MLYVGMPWIHALGGRHVGFLQVWVVHDRLGGLDVYAHVLVGCRLQQDP